ncbi:MAG: GAF domain-containing protein [Chloroflexota bacterium]|nr:GAF domain-containing protein [Chloroflexota bacterium]
MPGTRPEDAPGVEARLLRTLYELSVPAGVALNPGELIKLVAQRACDLLHGDAVALYLWDEAAGTLVPAYSNDPRQPIEDQPLLPGQGAAGLAVRHRRPVVVDDYEHWENAVAWGVALGIKSVEAVPLMVGDRSVGALIVRFYNERRILGPEEERILVLLAAQVAPALEAARLYATSTLERQHERALREITQALAANLDERDVLDLAVGYGATLLEAPYARIWLFEESGELSCAAAEGFVQQDTFELRLAHDSTSGRVAREQVVNLANAPVEASWKFDREFGERTGLGAYLGAGLWRAGESLGVLEVMRHTGHRFTPVEEQLLVSLANAVAVAVSNARDHAAVQRLAHEAEERASAVAESEVLLRSVYEAIGSGVLVFDGAGTIVNANAAAADILGRRVGELLGMRAQDFNAGVTEDGAPVRDEPLHLRAVEGRQAVRKVAFGITRPDGGRRWLQVDAVPLFGQDGALRSVILSFIDITDTRRSEEALHQRDAILEAVAFAAERLLTAAEWEHSIDDVLRQFGVALGVSRVYIVPAAQPEGLAETARHHEWTAEQVQPRPQPTDYLPYLTSAGLGRWENVLREGGIIQGRLASFPDDEQAILAAQGVCSLVVVPIFVGQAWWGFVGFDDCREERGWPAGTVEALKTAAGTIGAAIFRRRAEAERLQLVREQSARAEAEAAQRRLAFLADASEALAVSLDFEVTLQSVADLVVPAFADYCRIDILEANGTLRRIATAADARFGADANTLASPPIDAASDHPVAVVTRTGCPLLAPPGLQPFTHAGDARHASCLIVPLVTSAGPTGALTWRLSDARPAYELQDLQLAHDLARRCALAIDNARLYTQARAAVSIRDEFMSVAAHELKTPMTSLRGYAQLLGREFDRGAAADPVRLRRAALTIQVQSDKLARLVGQLLDLSRIEAGKLAIERKPTDLSALVRDVVDAARSQLKQHELVASLPEAVWVPIDPLRIEQVVTNLLDNAIKYSPEAGRIDVALSEYAQRVEFSVQDHGLGVAPEHRTHIFDRFYQAHAGGALTSMAGMGLGLYISRQIVDLHRGTIRAEFPVEGGTRFVVSLPRADS